MFLAGCSVGLSVGYTSVHGVYVPAFENNFEIPPHVSSLIQQIKASTGTRPRGALKKIHVEQRKSCSQNNRVQTQVKAILQL